MELDLIERQQADMARLDEQLVQVQACPAHRRVRARRRRWLFNLTTRAGWRPSKGFVTLLAAIRGKKKTTVRKLTYAIARADHGSILRPSLIPAAFQSG
jgi:hypothetical protein